MNAMSELLDTVAEAIRQADPLKLQHRQNKREYLDDYRRMAQAAIDALQLPPWIYIEDDHPQ